MIARLDVAVFDAPEIEKVGTFYAELTGWKVVRADDLRFGLLAPNGQEIEFQHAPDHVAPRWPGQDLPQHFHLDLQTEDPDTHAARAVALGATRVADGEAWITLIDPAGHPFDLCRAGEVDAELDLFAVTIDAPDATALARFYAELAGMTLDYDGPEGALIGADGRYLMFQQVDGYTPPGWPDPARPQQAHLDLAVEDLDAGEKVAVGLGGTRLDGGGDRYRVFTDPAGHPFCLVC